MLYLPGSIPVGAADEGTDLDAGVQFSRFWFSTDNEIDGKKFKGYLEMDLFGGALGNEAATNTYGVTIRHAFVSYGNWLAGQTWSNFQDLAALPDAVDFVGPTEGTVFVRQTQVRYTNGPWSVSLENPETLLTPYRGGAGRISSDDNYVPDLTARYLTKGDWGHFTVAGLARQLRYETTTGIDADGSGYGLSVSGKYNLGKSDDLRYMATVRQRHRPLPGPGREQRRGARRRQRPGEHRRDRWLPGLAPRVHPEVALEPVLFHRALRQRRAADRHRHHRVARLLARGPDLFAVPEARRRRRVHGRQPRRSSPAPTATCSACRCT